MASTLQVDDIQNTSGTNLLVGGYPRMPGQIIEVVTSPCDGSAVTVGSGTYTVGNVSAVQVLTASYADITGSSISYTPPTGTTRVRYIFEYNFYWPNSGSHCISHHKFFLDGVEVVFARHSRSGVYPEGRYSFEWTVAIGGTPNTNTGRIATWTGARIMKMQSRFYGAGNPMNLHGTNYWDGTTSTQLGIPVITVMAIV